MADVRDAVVHLQSIALALSGMREAPADPRAMAGAFPCAMSYAGNGTFEIEPAGCSKGLHHIMTDMFMPRQTDLALSLKTLSAFIDDFAAAVLAAPTIGGHVATIVTGKDGPPLRYTLVNGTLAGIDTVALHWDLTVKITNTL
jgi:hypothetical protein